MNALSSLLIGYLLGSLSPAALISKIKNKNLREHGTKNLGASNAMLTFGKWYGLCVMLFDIAKAFAAVKIARMLFPALKVAGLLAGGAAVVGHVYPFYLKFKGGKGLAAFGGMVLGVDPWLFLFLLVLGLILMFVINYSAAMPMSAATLFPIMYGIRTGDILCGIIALSVSVLVIAKHFSNIERAKRGEDRKVKEYVKEHILN